MRKRQSSTLSEKEKIKKSDCNDCIDGWITSIDENGYEVAKACKCMQERRTKNMLRFASIPETFKDMRLNSFRSDVYKTEKSRRDIEIVVKVVKEYLKDIEINLEHGMGLYIYSHTKGSGKTRLATSIANELLHNHKKGVKFATSMQIINEIKRTWNKDSEYTESKLLDALSTVKVLVIDDFGTEQVKEWINDRYYSIINERYINKKATIFTSNYRLRELEYDDRITNRIEERVYQIPFPEESVRIYIADKQNKEMINKIMR